MEQIEQFARIYKVENYFAIAATNWGGGNVRTSNQALFEGRSGAMRINAYCVCLTKEDKVLLAIGESELVAVDEAVGWKKLELTDKYELVSHLWLDSDFDKSLVEAVSLDGVADSDDDGDDDDTEFLS